MAAGILYTRFYEKIDSISPSTASFGMDGGSAQVDYIVARSGLQLFLQEILGRALIQKTNDAGNITGRLIREIPLAHPEYNWLYASRINQVQGIGLAGANDAEDSFVSLTDDLERNMPKFYTVYEKYRVSVQFEPRPYLLLNDEQMGPYWNNVSYYSPTGGGKNYADYAEYLRFTRIKYEPNAQLLPSNNGSFFLHSPDLPGGNPQPISQANGAGPRITVVKNTVKITWFFVPYKMVTSKTIQQAYGRVNFTSSGNFFGFPDGSLLFLGMEINDYPGPVPSTTIDLNKIWDSVYDNKYCDITFVFEQFEVAPEMQADTPAGVPGWIVPKHHNMLPHSGLMRYCYCCNSNSPATGQPIYYSYDMRRLFLYRETLPAGE
jgi:hypothetical protein